MQHLVICNAMFYDCRFFPPCQLKLLILSFTIDDQVYNTISYDMLVESGRLRSSLQTDDRNYHLSVNGTTRVIKSLNGGTLPVNIITFRTDERNIETVLVGRLLITTARKITFCNKLLCIESGKLLTH